MPWLYNRNTGMVEHQNQAEWLADEATGSWSGLVNLNIPDSDTSAQAMAAAQAYHKAHAGSATPTTSNSAANTNGQNSLWEAAQGKNAGTSGNNGTPNNPISSVEQFLSGLTSANLWIRVAKVAIGGTLLIVGLAKMTGAGGVAAKAVKYAPLL